MPAFPHPSSYHHGRTATNLPLHLSAGCEAPQMKFPATEDYHFRVSEFPRSGFRVRLATVCRGVLKIGRDLHIATGQRALRSLDAITQQLLQQQAELQRLQTDMAAKDQSIGQLQTEMAAKDQRIQALEGRSYIERCESGLLGIPDNSLYYGSGHRHLDLTTTFNRAFRTTPVISIGYNFLDDSHDVNLRVNAVVTAASTVGLTVRLNTWSDSKLHGASVYWIACA